MDLTEAVDIKRWWQEYTEELYKKDLHNPDNHNGVITHLEPDILECEVKALESITTHKASGGDGILVELFQILKDDAVNVLHSICQQIWKTQQWSQDSKRCFHSNPKESESEVAQLCPTLCDPMDCSLPSSSVHEIFQVTILEWTAISFSRGSSQPRDRTRVSRIVGRCFYLLSHQGSTIAKKGNAKESSNYCTISLISHTSKVQLKIFQASPQ